MRLKLGMHGVHLRDRHNVRAWMKLLLRFPERALLSTIRDWTLLSTIREGKRRGGEGAEEEHSPGRAAQKGKQGSEVERKAEE